MIFQSLTVRNDKSLSLNELTFRTLWAFAAVFHQLSGQRFPFLWGTEGIASIAALELVTYILSILVILNPRDNRPWKLLLLIIVSQFIIDLPFVSNHQQIEALVSAALLLALWRGQPFPLASVRMATVLVYFWVTIHKLNGDFFNPEVSCATVFGGNVFRMFGLPDAATSLGILLPLTTVIAEALICTLLLMPRYAVAGVIVGTLFHLILGFDETKRFYNFSAPMFALLTLFLPARFFENVIASKWKVLLVRSIGAATVLLLMILHFGTPSWNSLTIRRVSFGGIFLIWLFLSTIFSCLIVRFARNLQGEKTYPRAYNQLWLPLLIFSLGTGPYIGFRTRSSLDMYSNLRVEPLRTNHFFLPSLDLFQLIGEGRDIRHSTDSTLQQLARDNFALTNFEFRRALSKGQLSTNLSSHDPDQRYNAPEDLLLFKLLWFRPTEKNPLARCQW